MPGGGVSVAGGAQNPLAVSVYSFDFVMNTALVFLETIHRVTQAAQFVSAAKDGGLDGPFLTPDQCGELLVRGRRCQLQRGGKVRCSDPLRTVVPFRVQIGLARLQTGDLLRFNRARAFLIQV